MKAELKRSLICNMKARIKNSFNIWDSNNSRVDFIKYCLLNA